MPAIITHHIFGEDVVGELPAGVVEGEEELLAFLLGNEGPDPFFARFRTLPSAVVVCHRFAHLMQQGQVTRAFMSLRDGVAHLPEADARVGRAFALGVVGHYALDRAAHPFVIAQQRALAEADPTLEPSEREVHGIIESDIDSWILWEKRGCTVEERPAASNLQRTERIDRVAGALMSQVAFAVFGVSLGADEYAGSVADYEFLYRLIDPAGTGKNQRLATVEGLARGRSLAESMAHYVRRSDDCPAANIDRRPWEDPFTGALRHESFADLFDEARRDYAGLAEAFVRGDEERFRELAGGLNYDGCPTTDL